MASTGRESTSRTGIAASLNAQAKPLHQDDVDFADEHEPYREGDETSVDQPLHHRLQCGERIPARSWPCNRRALTAPYGFPKGTPTRLIDQVAPGYIRKIAVQYIALMT